jgi:hypothetical protein
LVAGQAEFGKGEGERTRVLTGRALGVGVAELCTQPAGSFVAAVRAIPRVVP